MSGTGMSRDGSESRRERRRRYREEGRLGPPGPYALLPWLLIGLGAFSNLFQGKTPNPWIGGIGLFVFNSSTSPWCSGDSTRNRGRAP